MLLTDQCISNSLAECSTICLAAITSRMEFLCTKYQDMNKGLAQREIIHSTNIKEVRKIGKYLPTVRCKWTN